MITLLTIACLVAAAALAVASHALDRASRFARKLRDEINLQDLSLRESLARERRHLAVLDVVVNGGNKLQASTLQAIIEVLDERVGRENRARH